MVFTVGAFAALTGVSANKRTEHSMYKVFNVQSIQCTKYFMCETFCVRNNVVQILAGVSLVAAVKHQRMVKQQAATIITVTKIKVPSQ